NKKKRNRIVVASVVTFVAVLIADQLYLFGIPFGPFLPDLSWLDPTGSDTIHHWMLGALLLAAVTYAIIKRKRGEL
ncbi:MAG: hypothetical protein KGD60_15000, partial [Candidatus Thorarchaeota archaeon]|nr:hypothetical protein [Candidatus Thorarchaeota archaeon]